MKNLGAKITLYTFILMELLFIAAGAKVVSPIIVGVNSILDANPIIVGDFKENSITFGIPACAFILL